MRPSEEEELTRLIGRALREAPLRRAPPTLELRVRRAIERRAALPWWRRSFGQWPAPARVVFGLGCLAIAAASLQAVGPMVLPGTGALLAAIQSAAALDVPLTRFIPPGVLYAGALLYASLFALSAAAYRLLYLDPHLKGGPP